MRDRAEDRARGMWPSTCLDLRGRMSVCVPRDDTFSDEDDTVRARMPSVAEITLEAVLDTLDRVEASPRARELRSRAEVYRLAIAKRATVPPTIVQRQTMRGLVSSLHEAVVSSVDCGSLVPSGRNLDRKRPLPARTG
jgi:hypothetical protein